MDRITGRIFEEIMQYNEDNNEIVLSAKKLVENNWHVTLGSINTLQKEDVIIDGRMINVIVQLTSVEVIHPDNYSSHPINLKVDVKRNEKKLEELFGNNSNNQERLELWQSALGFPSKERTMLMLEKLENKTVRRMVEQKDSVEMYKGKQKRFPHKVEALKPEAPNEKVEVDLQDLPNKKDYIFAAVDCYSNFTVLAKQTGKSEQSTLESIKALRAIIPYKIIQHDNGTEFAMMEFKLLV